MSERLPAWIPKVISTVLIGALITGALSWASATSNRDTKQESDIAVLRQQTTTFDKSLDEVKASQRRIEDKLDRALEK